MKNSDSNEVKFTKVKQWYLPIDADSYKVLKSFGMPLIRIHEDMMPTIMLLFKKHKIKPHLVDFNDSILHPYLDELGKRWQSKDHRQATLTKSTLKFETTHASAQSKGREALVKVEASLRRFFTRWGYTSTFELSDSRGKLRLHVNYKYDSERMPIIPLIEDPTSLPQIKLDLGYVRLTLTLMKKEVEVNVSIAAGTMWNSIHTSRCLYSQISDVRPMIASFIDIVNKDPHNADNKPKG